MMRCRCLISLALQVFRPPIHSHARRVIPPVHQHMQGHDGGRRCQHPAAQLLLERRPLFWDLAECACACLVFVCRLRIRMISGGKLAMLYFATAPPACPQVVFSERDGAGSRGAHGGNEPVMPHVPLPYHRLKNRELLPAPGHIGPRRVGRRPFVCYARLHGVYARWTLRKRKAVKQHRLCRKYKTNSLKLFHEFRPPEMF